MTNSLPKGGHASGDIRDAFLEALENNYHADQGDHSSQPPLYDLCGKLWNCDDFLPSFWVYEIPNLYGYEGPMPRTYAQAARAVRGLLKLFLQ